MRLLAKNGWKRANDKLRSETPYKIKGDKTMAKRGRKPKRPEERQEQAKTTEEQKRESGVPGGGQGRVDEVGCSGVYPASGPMPPSSDAPVRGQASWGQGERGAEGYGDSGTSEI